MKSIRRILFASDFSKPSGRAFTTAIALAKTAHARLTVLHVIVPLMPLIPEQFLDSATLERLDTQTRQWSQRHLNKLAEKAKGADVRTTMLLREGDPASQIVRAARSTRADLIVVGTHGRSGVSKFFLGSVADRVLATARCPVLTVRGK